MDFIHHRVTENTEKSIQARNNRCALRDSVVNKDKSFGNRGMIETKCFLWYQLASSFMCF